MKNSKTASVFKSIVSAFDVRKWEQKSRIIAVVLLTLFVVATAFAFVKPSEQELMDSASQKIRTELEKDEKRSRRHVAITYNDLYFINYASFSTSGVKGISEKYVGFAGSVHHADEGAWNVTGQFINYTYRMLGCGQSVLYGAKLTILHHQHRLRSVYRRFPRVRQDLQKSDHQSPLPRLYLLLPWNTAYDSDLLYLSGCTWHF